MDEQQQAALTVAQRRFARCFARWLRRRKRRNVALVLDGSRRAGMTWAGARVLELDARR